MNMKLIKQKIYLPVKVQEELPQESGFYKTVEEGTAFFQNGDQTWWNNDLQAQKIFPENWLKEQEGYFFTSEQLNQLLTDVIKDALDTAAEKAKINYTEDGETTKVKSKKLDIDCLSELGANVSFKLNKESITKTLTETFNKFKV